MGLNETPAGERVHIGFFGRRNAGKSSVVNAVTGQDLAIVSPTKGTTTDPVYKPMELLPMGPVMIIDTPGFDDEGVLGEQRVQRTKRVLDRTDVAVLVSDSEAELAPGEQELVGLFKERSIPYIVARNKCDLVSERRTLPDDEMYVSAVTGGGHPRSEGAHRASDRDRRHGAEARERPALPERYRRTRDPHRLGRPQGTHDTSPAADDP